jgi:hypothetical protein
MQFGKKGIAKIILSIIFTLLTNFFVYNFRLILNYTTGLEIQPFTQHQLARYFCYFLFTLFFYPKCKSLSAFWIIFIPVLLLDSTTLIFGQEEIPLRFPFDTLYPLAGIICGIVFYKSMRIFFLAMTLSATFMFLAHYFIRPAIRWQMKEWRKPHYDNLTILTDSFLTISGTPIKLSDTLKAKAQLIELYFVGCVPCEQKYKVLKELSTTYKTSDLQIVLICNGEATPYPTFMKHWTKNKFDGVTFLYDNSQLMRKYGIGGYPTEFLFDKQKLINTDDGFGDDVKERWLSKEKEMLNQIINHEN